MSQIRVIPESARVRLLVAGAFTPSPSGRRFHLTVDTFAGELARAASGLRVTVADRLGAGATRTFEVSFDKLRAFQLSEVVAAIPELRALHALTEVLAGNGPLRPVSPEEGAAHVAKVVGTGRLSSAIAEALHGPQEHAPPQKPPAADPGAGLVEELLARADAAQPAAAARASVEAFIRAMGTRSSTPAGGPPPDARKTARDVLENALFATAQDILAAEPVARLESAWRGLRLLLEQCPASSGLALEVLDVDRAHLADAVERSLTEDAFERPDACFAIDASDDTAWLHTLAELGERAQFPVVVEVPPSLLGATAAELPFALDDSQGVLPEAWRTLRQHEASRWLCATLNRVVMASESRGPLRRTCFTSPVFAMAAMLAASFRTTGSFARIIGTQGGVRAPATWELPRGRDAGTAIPTEVFLPIRAQTQLAELGIVGLGSGRNADALLLSTVPTVYTGSYTMPLPAQLLTGRVVRFAQWVRDQVPADTSGEEVSTLFSQAAEIFLFSGSTEAGQLRAETVPGENGRRSLHVTATVRPEHAGSRFQLAFTLPMRG